MGRFISKMVDVRLPFFAFWFCGLLGILVDFDHVLKIILFPEKGWRFLHAPILVASCIALCCCGTYFGGLYLRYILKRKK